MQSAAFEVYVYVSHFDECDEECGFEECDYGVCLDVAISDQQSCMERTLEILSRLNALQALSMKMDYAVEDEWGNYTTREDLFQLPTLLQLQHLPFSSCIRHIRIAVDEDFATTAADDIITWIRALPHLSSLDLHCIPFGSVFSASPDFAPTLRRVNLNVTDDEFDNSWTDFLVFLASTSSRVKSLELRWDAGRVWDFMPTLLDGIVGIEDLTLWTLPPLSQIAGKASTFWMSLFSHLTACTSLALKFEYGRQAKKEDYWPEFIDSLTASYALRCRLIELKLVLFLTNDVYLDDLGSFLDGTTFCRLAFFSFDHSSSSSNLPSRMIKTGDNLDYTHARDVLIDDFRKLVAYVKRPAIVEMKFKAIRPDLFLRLQLGSNGLMVGHMNGYDLTWSEDGQMVSTSLFGFPSRKLTSSID